jgi:hypothetical protein
MVTNIWVRRHRQVPAMQSDDSFWIPEIRTVEKLSIVALISPTIRHQDVSFTQLADESAKMREVVAQGTALGSSRTENPADSAASANRWSPQMKLLLDGRRSHQINDAASWRLSAARKEYLSSDWVATSRTWSPGRISLHPRLSNRRRAAAPCLSSSVISLSRWRRQIAL